MNEITFNRHDFDEAKKQLKDFSEKIPSNITLQSVATNGGLFNLFDHNVTGEELNTLTADIQRHIININNLLTNSIKEFGQVYIALETLDKDYIDSIILNVEAADAASKQAKKAAEEAKKNTKDIASAMVVQETTVNVLTQFKSKLEKIEHLINIDEIWIDNRNIKNDLNVAYSKIKQIEEDNYKTRITNEDKVKDILKKLKLSYFLAGGSIIISVILFILNMIGVL